MKTNQIQILPIKVWIANSGLVDISKIEIIKVIYSEGCAIAKCTFVKDTNDAPIQQTPTTTDTASQATSSTAENQQIKIPRRQVLSVPLSEEDCATWTEDIPFYKKIVEKAGFTLA